MSTAWYWCSYTGADLAVVSRIQYLPTTRASRGICSRWADPTFMLEAMRVGADGVLISGCQLKDCHHIAGDEKALDHVDTARSLTRVLGIVPGHVRQEWISAAEGDRFAEVISEFAEQVRGLGANPLRSPAVSDLQREASAAGLSPAGAIRAGSLAFISAE